MHPFDIDELLNQVIQSDCRELHLTVGIPPAVVTKDGRIVSIDSHELTSEDTQRMMKPIAPEEFRRQLQKKHAVEFGLSHRDEVFKILLSLNEGSVSIIARR